MSDDGPVYLGLDPGDSSGGLAMVDADGRYVDAFKLKSTSARPVSPRDIADWVQDYLMGRGIAFAVLERVGSRGKDGRGSAFKFGVSYGKLVMLLQAHGIPYENPTPTQWQRAMSCLTKGDKKVTHAIASRMWPETNITHWKADALLLAEYARRLTAMRMPDE